MLKDFSPEQLSTFQAYTRLTVVSHVRGRQLYHLPHRQNEVSFQDFQDVLEEKKVVHKSLARKVDDWVIEHSEIQLREHNNEEMEARTMDYIEQAYALGFVDRNGHLVKPKK